MEQESIKIRITIGKNTQADIKVIYDFNSLKKLQVKNDTYFKDDFVVDVNTQIEIEGIKYKVIEIRTMFKKATIHNSKPAGISSTGEWGNPDDFNFEIMYFVEEI